MVPTVFHSVWVGPPMPAELAAFVATWTQVNAGWDHIVWSEADLDWLTNQDLFDNAERYTPHVGQFRADVARYEILHCFGGVYVDCDFEARRPIDELVVGVDAVAAWETDGVWVNNAFLGGVAGHAFFGDLIAGLRVNVARHRGKRPNVMTGPQYVTPVARRHDVKLLPSSTVYPYRWDELERDGEDFPEAYAVHHWANRRRKLAAALPCPR